MGAVSVRRLVAALAVLAAVSTGATPLKAGAAPAARGKLVLVGEGLYVVNADGSGLRQITSGYDEQPHWSPDGRSIAFVEHSHPVKRVVVVRGDGSARRVLGQTGSWDGSGILSTPDPWSPDGKRIAWGGCGGLCVFELASSRRRSIVLGSREGDFQGSRDGAGFS